jgi:hypothetical protein
MRLCGPQSRYENYKNKNILPVLGIEPRFLGCPDRSVVSIRSELSRQHTHVYHKVSFTFWYRLFCFCINVWMLNSVYVPNKLF